MYESFYGLNANPFRLVPDARFFYASSGHKRGLAYLRYGLHQGQGFVVVTGRPGTGKSTLVQTLFSELTDRQLVVASLSSTNLGASDILQAVGHSFDVYGDGTNKASLLIAIENFLKAKARQGKRVILIVDEAHNLPQVSLEELRMLSNFQLGDQSLLQIMLLGQHQLPDILARPDMEQLSQRVIASCHLKPLNKDETRFYIGHRLQCVGWQGDPSFSAEAVAVVYAASTGIPRLINIFCDRMLLAASLDGKHAIDLQQAKAVLAELQEEATGTFSRVRLEVDDLLGFEPLPGDDFLLTRVAVSATKKKILADGKRSHGEVPAQINEQLDTDNAVADIDDKQQAAGCDFEPSFSSEPRPESNTGAVVEDHPLDDADNVVYQKFEPGEQPGFDVEPVVEQVSSWKKPVAIIVLLAVVLMFMALFFLADIKKLLAGVRTNASAESVVELQKPQTETARQFESLPVATAIKKKVIPPSQLETNDSALTEDKQAQAAEMEETVAVLVNNKPDSLVAIEKPMVVVSPEITEKPVQLEIIKPEPKPKPKPVAQQPVKVEKKQQKEIVLAKIEKSAEIKKVVPKLEAKAPQPVAKENVELPSEFVNDQSGTETVSDLELAALIFDLISYYESGDLDGFSALFVKNAVADGMSGVAKIRKDYQRLFSSTDLRQMRVEDMQWQHDADRSSGSGKFFVSVWRDVNGEPFVQQGRLNIELVKNGDKRLVTRMNHNID